MPPKSVSKEPLLNAVARKLGHAAGTLTHVAHELTGRTALPEGTSTSADSKPEPSVIRKSENKKRPQTNGARAKAIINGARRRKPAASKKRRQVASLKRKK